MGSLDLFVLVSTSWVFFAQSTLQLQTSQTQVLMQLRKHLEYPSPLEVWENYDGDMCSISSSLHMSISCEGNSVSELRIMGDKVNKVSDFNGMPVPNHTLSERFSIDSFVTTLTRLAGLRTLSLVSLGIWGSLPDKIHRLYSLEYLDLGCNFLFGSVPPSMARMTKVQTLALSDNYFNDSVPDWLDSLSNLTSLSLKNNRFHGQFPSTLSRILTLNDISISHNQLSGKLPDLSTLTSLHVLDLRENHLDSELPSMPRGLVTVLLSKNMFSGKIPDQFGDLHQLQHLDLSFNNLSGTPFSSLFSLPNVSYLNLASNLLSGSLESDLACGHKLGFVDLSNNKFVGQLPSCLASTSDNRVVKVGGNCLSIDEPHQHKETFCKEVEGKEQSSRRAIGVLVAVVSGAVLVILLLALVLFFLYRKYGARQTLHQNVLPKVVQDNQPSTAPSEILANASKCK